MVPSDRLQTVLNKCVAARLTEPGFIPFVKSWFDLAGTSVFQCDGIYIRRLWYRRENDGVHRDAVKRLAEKVPSDRLQKVLKKCVVARLTKPGFIDAVMELAEHVPSDRLQTVLIDCVAERLTQPGFIDAVNQLAEKIQSDRLQTVLNDCVAERLTKPGFIDAVR